MNNEKTNSAVRVLRIIKALKGKSLTGLSNKALAEGLAESPVNISRAVATLINEGFVVKLDTGNFALSTQVLQIAFRHSKEISATVERIQELEQRIQAGAH